MRFPRAILIAVLPLSLAACGPEGPNKADTGLVVGAVAGGLLGNQFGKGGGRVAATAIGAVVGGIVGSEIGKSMDQQDRMLAQQAEYDAFERGTAGQPRRWSNSQNGRYGDVVPGQMYRQGSNDCRDYTHTIYIDGRKQTMKGTACRNPDGTWSSVS